ncbi:MAG: DUF6515 family protein [Pseudomonadota bacterium]
MSAGMVRLVSICLTIAVAGAALARPPAPPPPPPGAAPPPQALPGTVTRSSPGGHVGRRVGRLPGNPQALRFNSTNYAYHRGRFYVVTESGYQGVYPPVGIRVDDLPDGAQRVGRQADKTYLHQGVYYRRVVGGYQVVSVPR